MMLPDLDRRVLSWLGAFPGLPPDLYQGRLVPLALLPPDRTGMALSPERHRIIKQDILGGCEAEYVFTVILRRKNGPSPGTLLEAGELLGQLGNWASQHKPDLGPQARAIRAAPLGGSTLRAQKDNADQDLQISIQLLYEVI